MMAILKQREDFEYCVGEFESVCGYLRAINSCSVPQRSLFNSGCERLDVIDEHATEWSFNG
jgi:hypothetical protein